MISQRQKAQFVKIVLPRQWGIATLILVCAALAGCGGNSLGGNNTSVANNRGDSDFPGTDPAPMCFMEHITEEQIFSVQRTPPDAPLADLSHYAPRNAAVDPSATLNSGACATNTSFRFAVGIGDITGAASGSNMAGYVDGEQVSVGILDRQHARAFIFESDCEGRIGRVVLVQTDLGLAFHAVRQGVLDALALDVDLAPVYGDQNVLINPSHSHATAAGQSHFDAYHVLTNGHDPQNYDVTIDGIIDAVRKAHVNLQTATPGRLLFNQAELMNGTTNRSVPAYLNNPEADRQAFLDVNGDEVRTNRMMSLIRLRRDNGTEVGMVNWYPIHATSIYQRNELLSGDNKGYAAYRFEQDFSTDYFANLGEETFAAGFMQADEGDASPSLFIPELSEAELRDLESDGFRSRGGGRTEPENALISGFKQYSHARDLFDAANISLTGEVLSGSIFVDFTQVVVDNPASYPPELQPVAGEGFNTCSQALGVSFAGGAEDGRGPTAEGQTCTNTSNADLGTIVDLIVDNFEAGSNGALPPGAIVPVGCDNFFYDARGYACHAEKPIIFPLNEPSPFLPTQTLEPTTQKLQIVILGNLAIIALPWETTTMAGRRIRNSVLDTLEGAGIDYAVISGLSNGFVHYLTTREEYATQQYEGASTIFGPWTQEAAQQELVRLATHLRNGTPIASPFADPGFRSQRSSFVNSGAADDGDPPGAFGDVVLQPQAEYQIGDEPVIVEAHFVAGHPRRNLKTGSSYLFIERRNSAGAWELMQTDTDWFTRFEYRPDQPDGSNIAVITWIVPPDALPGTYRIRHEGESAATGPYEGMTNSFELRPCDA